MKSAASTIKKIKHICFDMDNTPHKISTWENTKTGEQLVFFKFFVEESMSVSIIGDIHSRLKDIPTFYCGGYEYKRKSYEAIFK